MTGPLADRASAVVPEPTVVPESTGPAAPWVLHVDLDQFLAAVEFRRHPELHGRPVVVGGTGDPTRPRTVVSCASYEARTFGVHSGMPLRAAARRCPDAVFLPVDLPACEAASAEVMDLLRGITVPTPDGAEHPVAVEVWGWDEAFVGATVPDPAALADRMRADVLTATGLVCSVGIGDTKLRAKTATGFGKPDGVGRLTAQDWLPVMGDRPVDALWGIGARTAARLAEHGIATVRDLALADPAVLAGWFGPSTGPRLWQTGAGEGDRQVRPEPREPRSRSRQVTYPTDLSGREDVAAALVVLARELVDELVRDGRTAARVGVTVRTATFWTRSLTSTLPAPTADPDEFAQAAVRVLDRFDLERPVRLLGVRAEFPAG